MLGSAGIVVIDDQTCMVEFALRTIQFYQHESCGWCIPCREGTDWLNKTIRRVHAGGGVDKDLDNIRILPRTCWGERSARWAMRRQCRPLRSSRSFGMSLKII